MKPDDFVFQQIYKGALKENASERCAKDQAVLGLDDYKKSNFNKVIELINQRIAKAKKDSKNERLPA